MDGQVDDLEALDAGLGDGEVLLECDVCHVGKAPIDDVQVAGAAGRRIIPSPCGPPGAPRKGTRAVLLALRAVAGSVAPWPGATRTRWRRTSRWWP